MPATRAVKDGTIGRQGDTRSMKNATSKKRAAEGANFPGASPTGTTPRDTTGATTGHTTTGKTGGSGDASTHPLDTWLKRELTALYADVEAEPLPPKLADLAAALERRLSPGRADDDSRDSDP